MSIWKRGSKDHAKDGGEALDQAAAEALPGKADSGWPVDDSKRARNLGVLAEVATACGLEASELEASFKAYFDPYTQLPLSDFARFQSGNAAATVLDIELPYACRGHFGAMRTLMIAALDGARAPRLEFSQSIDTLPVADRSPGGAAGAGPQGHSPLIKNAAPSPGSASAQPAGHAGRGQAAGLAGVSNIIAVASGKGGVGKSTSSVNLALALQAEGARVGIVDADIYGPSMGMMCGVAEGLRPDIVDFDGQRFFQPVQVFGDLGPDTPAIQLMSMAFLVNEKTPMIWRGPMVSGALMQLITQTHWQKLDYLIVDLPPGTGDIQLTLSQKVPLSAAVIVTTPQDIALLDARKAVSMFEKVDVPVLGVVENMSVHICSNCGHREALFGSEGGAAIAAEFGLPLLGQIPLHITIREQTDQGRPSVYAEPESEVSLIYRDMARKVSAQLAILCAHAKNAAPSLIAQS